MIIDSFIFYNEWDILDIRFEELYPVVDKFVVVESNMTFQGQYKPLLFEQMLQRARFAPYADKIIYYNFIMPDDLTYSWDREYAQRNAIKKAVKTLAPPADAIILISDADEIPRRSAVAELNPQPVMGIGLDIFYYNLNVKDSHEHTIRAIRYDEFLKSSPQQIRTLDVDKLPRIYHAGWHFSYLGDADHIANKFKAFAHAELNRPDTTSTAILQQRMRAHRDLWGDGHTYEVVEIDDTWPEAVKNNREHWRKFEWKE